MISYALPIAERLRGTTEPLEPVDLYAIADSLHCDVREKALRASEGGLQAMTFRKLDRYSVIIDPNPSPEDEEEVELIGIDAIRRFRFAHELAHVATGTFSRDGLSNKRIEDYCDLIASAVLVASLQAADAVESGSDNVVNLARTLNAPTRSVVLSATLIKL